jgi:hypothetical protein
MIDGESREWEEEVESSFQEAGSEGEEQASAGPPPGFAFEKHPLYREALAFTAELDEMFSGVDEAIREHPAVVELHSQATVATAKLAAALNDDDIDELGMSIAYLKRGLRALTVALNSAVQMQEGALIDAGRFEALRSRIFSIRDGIVSTRGDYRSEFRRRHGRR